ncbi:ATP-binding protein [Streptomyces sp. CoH27]|uniref:ATP-binding protein n=1 Tax=Streptomyces sp. CoH27 TaxID=2875763 RepID=UPI001CD26722|nr:ATP-binding protein [Streptomyces sp. CoH27]
MPRRDVPDDLSVPGGPVTEILGVLLDNARVHGRGTVRPVVRDLDDALALDVTDEGEVPGTAARLFDRGDSGGGQGMGIGLDPVRDPAFAVGGRLSLTGSAPTTLTLLVPVSRAGTVDGTA